ncbi:MAG: tetratricopeptide repeat protein [Phycisphaerales bacterium]|nr:tetratricopeptide repeat protein [Phycisphaerales bacterium]
MVHVVASVHEPGEVVAADVAAEGGGMQVGSAEVIGAFDAREAADESDAGIEQECAVASGEQQGGVGALGQPHFHGAGTQSGQHGGAPQGVGGVGPRRAAPGAVGLHIDDGSLAIIELIGADVDGASGDAAHPHEVEGHLLVDIAVIVHVGGIAGEDGIVAGALECRPGVEAGVVIEGAVDPVPLRDLIERRERFIGADASATLASKNNLAKLLHRTDRLEQSRDMYREVLEGVSGLYLPDHMTVILVRTNLGMVMTDMGDLVAAHEMLDAAYQALDTGLPPEHPQRGITGMVYANVLSLQGQVEQAGELLTESLALLTAAFPSDHHYVETCRGYIEANDSRR